MVKRITSFIMVITISLGMVIFPASAATYNTSMSYEDYLKANFKNFEAEIDISDYIVKKGMTMEEARDEYIEVVNNNAELFYVNVTAKFKTIGSTHFISGVNYICTKSQLATKQKEMKNAAAKALATINDSMTDAEKIMALHEYMILNTNYDTTEKNNGGYEALVLNSAICQGYARGFQYLLSAAGYQNQIIREKSSNMNHGWNIVKLGDDWFHVDTTKDDPISSKMDSYGRVSHKYSLSSDKRMRELGHTWEESKYPSATNTKYDNAPWRETRSPMIKFDDYWYYIELDYNSPTYNKNYTKLDSKSADYNDKYHKTYANIYKYDWSTGKKTTVYTIDSTWYVWGKENAAKKTWQPGNYSSIAHYNGIIYFNDAKSIYKLDPNTSKVSKLVSPKDMNGYIYGMNMNGNKITYTIKQKPVAVNTLKSASVSKATSTALALDKKSFSATAGKTYSVKATLTPGSSKDYVYWTTSDKAVATVKGGKVAAVKSGTAIITAYTSTGKKASVTVKVK